MKPTELSLTIKAPIEKIFAVIADVEGFQTIVPEIVNVEFLSEQKSGVGTRLQISRQSAQSASYAHGSQGDGEGHGSD
ncbi:MAG: ribosome-associated toxin RatA of RatAB toxin-antitoxin module [Planctomycetota bacterium]